MQRVILIGGSGKQAGAVYLPILLDKNRTDLQLVALADPTNPSQSQFSKKYEQELHDRKTAWINLTGDISKDLELLTKFISKEAPCDTLAISCPPTYHAAYTQWGLKHGMDVIVDKPYVCRPFQFGDSNAAANLRKDLEAVSLARQKSKHNNKNRQCMISVPVMRRVTSPYTKILEGLKEVYAITDQNLTHMMACRSDGCFRFAEEFDRPGAHGYREGLGTLTMSGYHYIDFMSACLMSAPPKGTVLKAHMVTKTTVSDVRNSSQNIPYGKFLSREKDTQDITSFQGDNAELDLSVSYIFKEENAILPDSELYFSFIQRGSTRRISPFYGPDTTHDEGLTNDCVMVIHQGPFQSFHCLVTQDPSTDGRITLVRRLNPKIADKLGIPTLTITDFPLANNENTLNNQKIITGLLAKFEGSQSSEFDLLDGNHQRLTVEMFAATMGASVADYSISLSPDIWEERK